MLIGLSVKQDYNNAARHRAPVVFIVISRFPVGGARGEDTLIIVVGTDVQTGPHFLLWNPTKSGVVANHASCSRFRFLAHMLAMYTGALRDYSLW